MGRVMFCHPNPFQCKASPVAPTSPKIQTSFGVGASTMEPKKLGGADVRTDFHLRPFQCQMSGPGRPYEPTAQASSLLGAAISLRKFPRAA
jgi:hypothetical protein